MAQAIQIIGALIILGAFGANQLGELPTDSRLYLVANLVGSTVLCILAVAEGQIGFVLLEGDSQRSVQPETESLIGSAMPSHIVVNEHTL